MASYFINQAGKRVQSRIPLDEIDVSTAYANLVKVATNWRKTRPVQKSFIDHSESCGEWSFPPPHPFDSNLNSWLPFANEVCEGYVFTPVSQSFCSWGVSRPRPGGGLGDLLGSVQAQAWGRGCVSQHALRQTPPSPADGYFCGRYASHWSALLLENDLLSKA